MRHRISLALLLALLLVGYAAWAYPPHRGGMGYGSAGTPPIGTLTGIALANNSFVAPASDGTVVGAITVQGSGSIAGATLSVTGDGGLCPGSSCPFRLSNTTVPSNLLVNGTQNAGTYSINLVATLAGAVGSPFTQPETVTGAALTITGVSISCGSSCVFTPPGATGTAIGTLSATVSSGSPSVTWALSASADICNPTNGAGNANFQIAGNVVQVKTSNLGSGTYQLCATASGSYGNSPKGLAFTVTGTSLPPGFFVATNGTNNGTCSISQPCTFAAAQTAMQNSSTKRTYVRAGTYNALNYPTFNGCVSSSVMILLGASDSNETWQYYPPDGINTALFNAGPGRTFGETQNRQKAFCIEQATNVTINGLAFWYWHTGAAILSPGNGALIENNQIYYNYENILSPVAVIGGSTGAKIYHNDIEHVYGAAVNVQSGGENIDMRYNFVDDSCLSTDGGSPPGSDCGGLYNIGVNSGTFIGNYVRNTSVPSNGNGGRCIYLDETANNQTVNGNICTGIFGETLFNHASNHDNMNSNISDLWNQFDQQFLASQYSSPPNTDMLGNTFQHNIVVTKNNGGGGNGATNFGVPNPNPTTINDNLYFNYGTGGNVFAGGSPDVVNGTGSDPNPTRSNPLFLTCPGGGVDSWSFKLNPTSPAFSAPVSFPAQGNNDVGIAWGQPGFWGPPGFTIPHTGNAPSYGPTCGGSQNSPLAAPTTAQGNYGTGCSGTCLTIDDHWTSATLDTTSWYPGWSSCNNVSGQQCVSVPGGGGYAFPLSGGCWGQNGGCQDEANYDYPYGYPTNTSPVLTHTPLTQATDGSLAFSAKLYSTTVQPTASNNPLALPPYCNSVPFSTANCAFIYWTGAGITSGGVNGSANVNNTAAIIPIAGGMFQWRMKLDAGLLNGMYPAMECGAVGGAFKGLNVNANFEFGYTGGTGALHAVGISMNNTAIGSAGNVYPVNTGDDGAGSGDLRNWHVYAAEWTGSGTHQWHYYIDGAEMPTTSNNEASLPTIGWTCTLKLGVAQNQTQGGCHTLWDTGHPGPYFMWVSDAQVYKKPGT